MLVAQHGLSEGIAHAIGVDHHRETVFEFAQEFFDIVVGFHLHIILLQVCRHLIGDFFFIHEEHALAIAHKGKSNCHRRVSHIRATHIQQPRDIVECRDKQRIGIRLLHGIHHTADFAFYGFAGKCFIVYKKRIHGSGRSIGPHRLCGTEIGGKHKAILGTKHFDTVSLHQRKQATIHAQHRIFIQSLSQPLQRGGLSGNVFFI